MVEYIKYYSKINFFMVCNEVYINLILTVKIYELYYYRWTLELQEVEYNG